MATVIQLSRRDARETARLLREFQIHLESAIETTLLAGEKEPREEIDRANVEADRVKFHTAEGIIRRIDTALGDRRTRHAR